MLSIFRRIISIAVCGVFLVATCIIVAAQPPRAIKTPTGSVYWLKGASDSDKKIGEYFVGQYMNAGTGGYDWTIFGSGARGGDGDGQLWLFDSPSRAIVQFSKKSRAVAFLMRGDHNDGYAQFIVDGKTIGTYDLYNLGKKTLVVSGLPDDYHTIQVVHLEKQHHLANDDHVAIFGGAALTNSAPAGPADDVGIIPTTFQYKNDWFRGGWHRFRSGKSKWLFRREGTTILTLYSSPNEIGRANGKFKNNQLVLTYRNAFQEKKKYPFNKGVNDTGKIVCTTSMEMLTCRILKGRMNQGLEFNLERGS